MSRDVLDRPAPPPDLTLSYGPHSDNVVDVRLPASAAPAPLVVVVHGGFWRKRFDREHAGSQSAALAEAGYVVATVEYRRVGRVGSGWPHTLDDAALFADEVPTLLAGSLPGRVELGRTVFVGHSAGGHLVTWLAARHVLPASSPWATAEPLSGAFVSLAGVVDLALAEQLGLGGHAAAALLGGSPAEQPDRYAQADPARLLPTGVRTVLVQGLDDVVVPAAVSRSFAAAARSAGDDVVLHELEGADHDDVIDPTSAAWPAVLAAVAEALR
ncbi:MAG TPA: alpha/beta hydrolase [Actinomycetes bacterium]